MMKLIKIVLLYIAVFIFSIGCGDNFKTKTNIKQFDTLIETTSQKSIEENSISKKEWYSANDFYKIKYLSDLMTKNAYKIDSEYKNMISKNQGFLKYNLVHHGKVKSIYHHPLTHINNSLTFFDLEIGKKSTLQFSIAIFTENNKHFYSDGAEFKIVLKNDLREKVIFEQKLNKFDKWNDFSIDLSGYYEKDIEIQLITTSLGNNNCDWAVWGTPRIINHKKYDDYSSKEIANVVKFHSLINTFCELTIPDSSSRADRGWIADTIMTDIILSDVTPNSIIRNELYVLERFNKLENEQIKVELYNINGKLIETSNYKIVKQNQIIQTEYKTNNDRIPKKIRMVFNNKEPSIVFIKEPIVYDNFRESKKNKENVILISLDTLRADHLSCYGYHRNVSPNIDTLASESLIFDGYSNSNWTLPAHTSLFTSLYPSKHKIVLKSWENGVFQPYTLQYYYITEAFKQTGYLTAAFTGGAYVHSRYGYNKGFDYHVENIVELNNNSLNCLLNFIRTNKNNPLFIFFHTFEIHDYYLEKPSYKEYIQTKYEHDDIRLIDLINLQTIPGVDKKRYDQIRKKLIPDYGIRYIRDLYDSAIFYTDNLLGNFFNELKEMGIYDKTWIIITSDHGEGFGDIHNNHYTTSWTHGSRLYDNQIKIPFIIKPPKQKLKDFSKQETIKILAQTIDLAPTFLYILGLKPIDQFEGKNLLSFFIDDNVNVKSKINDKIFSEEINGRKFSVIYEDFKLIMSPISYMLADENQYTYELYNLKGDKEEKNNLLDDKHHDKYFAIYQELKQALDKHVEKLFKVTPDKKIPISDSSYKEYIDDQQIKRLKELGYL